MDLGKHKEIANVIGSFAKGRYNNYDKGTKKAHRSRINGDVCFLPTLGHRTHRGSAGHLGAKTKTDIVTVI